MLDLLELEQLVAFADCGRLSKAAEKLNISQPTITRTMQHLEEEFDVPIFSRSRNHIALNETGQRAVEHARALLKSADQAVKNIRSFDKGLHTDRRVCIIPFQVSTLKAPGQCPEIRSSLRLMVF